MPFQPGNKLSKGRPKGSKNKFTTLKESFIEAYIKLGGTQALLKWIKEDKKNRAAFYHDLIRIIPASQLTAIEKQSMTYELSEKFLPKVKIEVVRTITDKRPDERIIEEIQEPEQSKLEEDKVIEIESLSMKQIETEIKTLESKKKEIEAVNKAS